MIARLDVDRSILYMYHNSSLAWNSNINVDINRLMVSNPNLALVLFKYQMG